MPQSSRLFTGAAVLFSFTIGGVFFFLASAAVTWHRNLLFGHGPLFSPSSSSPKLSHISPTLPSSPPIYRHLLVGDLSATFCPHVASDSKRHYTVISIRRTCLLICPPACQSACLPARLHACLPANVLPTAMPYSCPIHLVLNKRLLSSGHPSLHWPLFFCGQTQEWGLALKGIDCWGWLWMHTLVLPSCFYSVG